MTLVKIIQLVTDVKKSIEGRSEPHPLDPSCIEAIDAAIAELRKCRGQIDRVREGLDEV